MTRTVACIGAGVIGSGWVARFLLNGINVQVFDPDPDSERSLNQTLNNAERAYQELFAALPPKGQLRYTSSMEAAVANVSLVQENLPERLELKQSVLQAIDRIVEPDVLIASSTSGLLPSALQQNLRHPERLLVAHPYNPVYLLPLVELVPGTSQSAEITEEARRFYTDLGMKPILVKKEIDGFVGDRLLEALWREALWLIKDDITTVADLDDVMRYSFGLRWAQMGLFQTYRLAGGEAGMRHFLTQFGPALKWPWSKLTDVPELDNELIEKIESQSDAQNTGWSTSDLEQIRDDNLVGFLKVLESANSNEGWGAGTTTKEHAKRLAEKEGN